MLLFSSMQVLSGATRPALDNTLKNFWISWRRLEKKNKEDKNLKMHGLLGKIEKMCLVSLKQGKLRRNMTTVFKYVKCCVKKNSNKLNLLGIGKELMSLKWA